MKHKFSVNCQRCLNTLRAETFFQKSERRLGKGKGIRSAFLDALQRHSPLPDGISKLFK